MTEASEAQEFVPLAQLAQEAGVPASTLRRHLRTLQVAIFEHPRDRRVRLVRVEDAAALRRPRLIRAGGNQIVAA
jgi:DNA-binding IclR family transcriptional regulator